jgi:hypothetical protein
VATEVTVSVTVKGPVLTVTVPMPVDVLASLPASRVFVSVAVPVEVAVVTSFPASRTVPVPVFVLVDVVIPASRTVVVVVPVDVAIPASLLGCWQVPSVHASGTVHWGLLGQHCSPEAPQETQLPPEQVVPTEQELPAQQGNPLVPQATQRAPLHTVPVCAQLSPAQQSRPLVPQATQRVPLHTVLSDLQGLPVSAQQTRSNPPQAPLESESVGGSIASSAPSLDWNASGAAPLASGVGISAVIQHVWL